MHATHLVKDLEDLEVAEQLAHVVETLLGGLD